MSDALDLEAIRQGTAVRHLHFVDTAASTNELARELLSDALGELPLLIVAEHQTAGRGQGAHRWWSGPGSLTFSLVIAGEGLARPQMVAIGSALAVATAIQKCSGQLDPRLKWPNDVLIDGKKVAGILIESFRTGQQRILVIGIGVNTNCRLHDAPPIIRDQAVSLREAVGTPIDQTRFLVDLLKQLEFNLNPTTHSTGLMREYAAASVFETACPMVVRQADGEKLAGNFLGFGAAGQLRLKIGARILELSSGRIVEYR